MTFYIGIQDLAANAMIEILKRKSGQEPLEVTFRDLENYGAEVVKFVNKQTDKQAVLILSRASTTNMFWNYSEYFKESEDEEGIILQAGKTAENLKFRFRTYLGPELIQAYESELAVKKLDHYFIDKKEVQL